MQKDVNRVIFAWSVEQETPGLIKACLQVIYFSLSKFDETTCLRPLCPQIVALVRGQVRSVSTKDVLSILSGAWLTENLRI